MKIAYVIATYPCLTETFIRREIEALRRRGADVRVFALRGEGGDPSTVYRAPLLSIASVRSLCRALLGHPSGSVAAGLRLMAGCIARPILLLKCLRSLPALFDFAREARKWGAQRVHAHFLYVPGLLGCSLARLLDVPFSASAHAWDIYTKDRSALAGMVTDAAFVACCTMDGRERVLDMFPELPRERFPLIRHGVDPHAFPSPASDGRLVLAIGRLEEKKGFLDLVDACIELRKRDVEFDCKLVGEGHLRSRIADRAQGAAGSFTLIGALPDKEVIPLLRQAAVLVVPSIIARTGDHDGLPNVILEAMAASVPIVATRVGGIAEAVRDGENGILVDPGDVTALADGIAGLLADTGRREAMGLAARETVMRDFDLSQNVEQLYALFEAPDAP